MKKILIFFFLFTSLFFISLSTLHAQVDTTDAAMVSKEFDTSEFPLWVKDLRRGEIIAFGSFPFAYFFANFGYDAYRWSNNGWDNRYAPWPLNSAATVEQTQDEKIMTLGLAAGTAVLIAIIDYGIMRFKRNRLEREMSKIKEGTPIIIKTPLSEWKAEALAEEPAITATE
jgi:hypothetical protein